MIIKIAIAVFFITIALLIQDSDKIVVGRQYNVTYGYVKLDAHILPTNGAKRAHMPVLVESCFDFVCDFDIIKGEY
jgi:hypothetical protein